jgi:hypothetical protein
LSFFTRFSAAGHFPKAEERKRVMLGQPPAVSWEQGIYIWRMRDTEKKEENKK